MEKKKCVVRRFSDICIYEDKKGEIYVWQPTRPESRYRDALVHHMPVHQYCFPLKPSSVEKVIPSNKKKMSSPSTTTSVCISKETKKLRKKSRRHNEKSKRKRRTNKRNKKPREDKRADFPHNDSYFCDICNEISDTHAICECGNCWILCQGDCQDELYDF